MVRGDGFGRGSGAMGWFAAMAELMGRVGGRLSRGMGVPG